MAPRKAKMAPVTQVPTPQTIQHDSHQQADSMDIDDHTTPTPGDYPVDETTTQGGFPDDTPSTPIRGGDQSSPQPQEQDFHRAKAPERPQASERPEQSTQAAQRPAKKSSHDLIAELWRRLEQKDEEMSKLRQAQMNANTSSTDSRLADQLSKLFEQKDSQSMLDREEQRLRQLAQTYWRETKKLHGRDNYSDWRKGILFDADYLGARDILLQPDTVPKATSLQQIRFETSKQLLHKRILDCLTSDIADQVQMDHTQQPSDILSRLDTIYGISPAEKRLLLVKTLLNLKPQGNYIAMMRQWQRISTELERQDYPISEVCHDIGIILLGEHQRSFMRTQLDHLFIQSKRNQSHEIDMAAIINQLESRTPSAPGHYKPLSYTIYRQEPWGHTPQIDNQPPKGGNKKSQPITGTSSDPSPPQKPSNEQSKSSRLCPHCKRGYHKVERCWVLHPELRPPKENPPPNGTSSSDDNRPKPITGTTGAANLVHPVRQSDNWILDTGTTWTIHNDKSAFNSYMPLTMASPVELPDGSTHRVEGVGTIKLPIGEHMVELKNARHVPTLHAHLLSFNQLEDQGFHIKLTDEKPYRFQIITPDKSASFLISRTTDKGMFNRLEKETGVINVVNDANDRPENKSRNLTPNRPPPASIEMWHHRLSHMNQHDLQYLHRVGRINIQGKKLLPTCDFCRQAKTTRRTGTGITPRATRPGRRLHVDIFGGGQTLGLPSDDDVPPANGKYKYVMILTDDATRMRWTFPLENRTNPNHHIRTHMDFLRRLGYETAYLRGDGEFFKNPREWAGIKMEPSAPYSPWQNGVSERGIRIILERTRAVLYASGLPRRFWLEALMDTTQKANYLPTSTPLFNDSTPDGNILDENIKKSPFYIPAEAWENRPMNISFYRPFGAKIWYHRHGTEKPSDKMDTRGAYGLLLTNLSSTNQLVWSVDKDSIIHVTNGRVDEGDISLTDPTFTPQPTTLTSSTNGKIPPIQPYSDDNPSDDAMIRPAKGFVAYVAGATSRDIPRTMRRALERKDKNRWLKAMQREFSKLQSKEIFELVRISDVPKGKRIFPGKWVYDSKEDYPPDDERSYKARWVILGNLVKKDDMQYDYCKYAPVVSAAVTRLLFALAAAFGWKLRKLDVAVAFLNGNLIDEIYMRQPYGFEQGEGLIWRLKKSIYGLVPAARIWYDTLTAALHRLGFRTCSYDSGLFIHQERRHLYITTHVDDFQLVAERDEDIEWTKDALSKEWEIKDVSNMTYYLGMEVEFVNGQINLLQREYIKDLVQSFGLENANPQTTPLPQGFEVDDEPDGFTLIFEYQRGTGKLQWLAVKTRPDIAEAAGTLARFNTRPTKKCWNGLLHVIRYLKGTIDDGLTYGPASTTSSTIACFPTGYSDSNWAGPNSGRKSIGGYIFLYEGSPISWQSKRQTCVATSSNEAEYMAISEAAKEAIWLRRVCIEMQVAGPDSPPICLHTDSEGAQALASTEGTKRSKHIDVRYHHIRDLQSLALVSVEGVRSQDNPADGLTKIQSTPKHRHFLHLINMDRNHLHPTSDGE